MTDYRAWPLQSECDSFYGDPRDDDDDSKPSREWEKISLVTVTPPWKMVDDDTLKPVANFQFHRKAAPSLLRVFDTIWVFAGGDQAKIEAWHMHRFAGSYVYRPIRGGSHLSMHAYGCAIDFAANLMPQGTHYDPARGLPQQVISAFYDERWIWGGAWRNPDQMHFQASRVG